MVPASCSNTSSGEQRYTPRDSLTRSPSGTGPCHTCARTCLEQRLERCLPTRTSTAPALSVKGSSLSECRAQDAIFAGSSRGARDVSALTSSSRMASSMSVGYSSSSHSRTRRPQANRARTHIFRALSWLITTPGPASTRVWPCTPIRTPFREKSHDDNRSGQTMVSDRIRRSYRGCDWDGSTVQWLLPAVS